MIDLRLKLKGKGIDLDLVKRQMQTAIESGVWDAALHVEGEVKDEIRRTFPQARTGRLMNSFNAQWVMRGGRTLAVGVYSPLEYARIQDEGGTIKPRSVKMLAIPLVRLPVGKWPRHFAKGELTAITSRHGNRLLVKTADLKRGKINPIFVLKKQVTIKGRSYLERARAKSEAGVARIIGADLARAMSVAVGVES